MDDIGAAGHFAGAAVRRMWHDVGLDD